MIALAILTVFCVVLWAVFHVGKKYEEVEDEGDRSGFGNITASR